MEVELRKIESKYIDLCTNIQNKQITPNIEREISSDRNEHHVETPTGISSPRDNLSNANEVPKSSKQVVKRVANLVSPYSVATSSDMEPEFLNRLPLIEVPQSNYQNHYFKMNDPVSNRIISEPTPVNIVITSLFELS